MDVTCAPPTALNVAAFWAKLTSPNQEVQRPSAVLVFSQPINRDDSWVKVGELAGRERNSFLFRLRILLAERNLGGDTPPVSVAGLWLTVRACTHSGLSSRAALLRRELSLRYQARLTA